MEKKISEEQQSTQRTNKFIINNDIPERDPSSTTLMMLSWSGMATWIQLDAKPSDPPDNLWIVQSIPVISPSVYSSVEVLCFLFGPFPLILTAYIH